MKKNMLYIIVILICGLFMNMGYAAISAETLHVAGNAVATKMTGLYISAASITNASNGDTTSSTITSYEQTVLNSRVVLDSTNSGAYLIMSVTITNNTGESQQFDKIVYDSTFYDNQNIIVETDGNLVHGQVISDGSSVTFNITFSYDGDYVNNNTAPYSNILNSMINFKFGIDAPPVVYHNVTYYNINTTNLPTSVEDGQDLVAIITGTVPSTVNVYGSSNYNYTNGTLVVYAVTNDLIISDINGIDLPLVNSGGGTETISFPGFNNGVYFRDFIGMSFSGANYSGGNITRIVLTANYIDTSTRDRDADINISVGGNTYTENLHVLGNTTTNADAIVEFNNISIPAGSTFSVNVTGQSNTRNITIYSVTLTAYYS